MSRGGQFVLLYSEVLCSKIYTCTISIMSCEKWTVFGAPDIPGDPEKWPDSICCRKIIKRPMAMLRTLFCC